jgi:predicted amidophosphoribosyltransferase
MLNRIQEHITSLFDTFFPRLCYACSKPLLPAEQSICLKCNFDMTKAKNYNDPNSKLNKKFWGRIPLGGVVAYYTFKKDSKVQHLIHQLKYKGKHEVGELIGDQSWAILILAEDSIIKNVDLVCAHSTTLQKT